MQYTIQTFCPIFFTGQIAKFILLVDNLMSVHTYCTVGSFFRLINSLNGAQRGPPFNRSLSANAEKIREKSLFWEKIQGSFKSSSSSTTQLQVALVKSKCSFG
jgi:hypothetical protein